MALLSRGQAAASKMFHNLSAVAPERAAVSWSEAVGVLGELGPRVLQGAEDLQRPVLKRCQTSNGLALPPFSVSTPPRGQ